MAGHFDARPPFFVRRENILRIDCAFDRLDDLVDRYLRGVRRVRRNVFVHGNVDGFVENRADQLSHPATEHTKCARFSLGCVLQSCLWGIEVLLLIVEWRRVNQQTVSPNRLVLVGKIGFRLLSFARKPKISPFADAPPEVALPSTERIQSGR